MRLTRCAWPTAGSTPRRTAAASRREPRAPACCGALEAWDEELGVHTTDVAELAAQVARLLGLDDDEVERIATAAELHDVGKIAIPRSILGKPAALDPDEWEFMRRHTLIASGSRRAHPRWWASPG